MAEAHMQGRRQDIVGGEESFHNCKIVESRNKSS